MLGMEVPIRTPTSFFFFAATGFATYFSREVDSLRWFAYSAFSIFLALGPARWIEAGIGTLQIPQYKVALVRREWVLIDTTGWGILTGWFFGVSQVILFVIGSYFGAQGLFLLS